MTDRPDLTQLMALMDHVEGQVVFGDTKASLLFTADAILLAALGFVVKDGSLGESLTLGARWALLVAGATLVAGLLLTLAVVLPSRYFAPPGIRIRIPAADPNHIFLRGIADLSRDEYVAAMRRADRQALEEDILRQVWGKSTVGDWKFRTLWYAVATTMFSISIAVVGASIEVISRL